MNTYIRFALLMLGITLFAVSADAQVCTTLTPTPPETEALIIDARPDRISPVSGRRQFGPRGTVVITNMNPFIFDGYTIKVEEKEIENRTELKIFTKLLIPFGSDLFESAKARQEFAEAARTTTAARDERRLFYLLQRVATPAQLLARDPVTGAFTCLTDGCKALRDISRIKDDMIARASAVNTAYNNFLTDPAYQNTKQQFTIESEIIFDRGTDREQLCGSVNNLLTVLRGAMAYPSQETVKTQRGNLLELVALATELKASLAGYKADAGLKDQPIVRSVSGFKYTKVLGDFADEISGSIFEKYNTELTNILTNVATLDDMKAAILDIEGKENTLLQQIIPIGGRYDHSIVKITVEPIKKAETSTTAISKTPPKDRDKPTGNTPPTPAVSEPNEGGGTPTSETVSIKSNLSSESVQLEAGQSGGGALAAASQTTGETIINRPRFELSAGIVYSSLERREFQEVLGFQRDREGNLTNGETLTKVVGFSEDSEHRLLPIAILNTRLTHNPNYNMYFSLGVTAKRTSNGTNVEYLVGPSVNLNKGLMLTVGGYAGKQQSLAGDLFLGAKLPSGVTKIPFRESYHWKPGFALTYRIPLASTATKTQAKAESGGGGSSQSVTGEGIINQPRFELSAGLAYSSLAKQQFQQVAGFARDRQGNLTNGETLTRIVGFREDSEQRLMPMAMLNTRLTRNANYNMYFSLGVTAKRDDAGTDVEYLFGPSVSVGKYLMLTGGIYAGKQQMLGGDLFLNAPLPEGQSDIPVRKEYHFKPGFAFTYRIPVKLP